MWYRLSSTHLCGVLSMMTFVFFVMALRRSAGSSFQSAADTAPLLAFSGGFSGTSAAIDQYHVSMHLYERHTDGLRFLKGNVGYIPERCYWLDIQWTYNSTN